MFIGKAKKEMENPITDSKENLIVDFVRRVPNTREKERHKEEDKKTNKEEDKENKQRRKQSKRSK